ncbi:hypothetical protein Tco_0479238 [Tanacetum coccineum]
MGAARLMFNELPPKSIDSFVEPRKAFLAYFLQQKKYIKNLVEIHHIKQMKGESTKAFMDHFKVESLHVEGAPECLRISGFMHGITNQDLIKRLNDNIPKSVDDIMSATMIFLRGEVAVSNHSKKKGSRHGNIMKLQTNQVSRRTWISNVGKDQEEDMTNSHHLSRRQKRSWLWIP